ncbi:DUF2141 domain-containing protein [Winogradskyella sp. PG-2]|uniref:DUF2141 domain-containing protein n=1 Tax=Winogradskyella sp. PG-2 TaxID=754409 RepID=UPI0004588F68|nr:DUF2141 domain-containing protein [Winogradskyella sp. PG-2]BAO74254.1 hypothetical protein WPG_0024 [Winogradskyella sp. PG-2]
MGTLLKLVVVLIISLTNLEVKTEETYSLEVKVEELDSNKGQMFISIYNTETEFLGKSYKGTKSKITNNSCVVTFEDLPKGTYAVSIFHDENNNGKLDSNFMGIPKEDYGCSNNARGFMGPPKWKDAKFQLKENKSITITL